MITLSNPTIIVNNDTWKIVPNSFKYNGGEGTTKVRAASAGGGSVESVHSEDAEDKIGKCSFDMYLSTDLDAKIAVLKENLGANSIEAVQRARGDSEGVTLSWDNLSLVTSPDREASVDGVVNFEFEGDPMSIQ